MKLSVVDQSPVPAGFTPADALHNSIDLAQKVESFGFTRYWVAEHHATPSLASPAPEILISRLGAETSTIRLGSGAVLLPHYAPLKVVESFRMLHALYPDRIDLGIGRAPGGSGLDSYALQRYHDQNHQTMADDFGQQLAELLAFMHHRYPDAHPFSKIEVSPEMPGSPDIWLLGSSGWSADAAAQFGLPYAAAHFINPATTRRSIEHYREHFQPSIYLKEPQMLVAVGAIVADTEAEAERLVSSQRLRRVLRQIGNDRGGPIPRPEDALERLATLPPLREEDNGEWPRTFVGSTQQVHDQLGEMARELQLEELMLVTVVHDHQARVRSHELLAHAFELSGVAVK